jgi:hypothetical protein
MYFTVGLCRHPVPFRHIADDRRLCRMLFRGDTDMALFCQQADRNTPAACIERHFTLPAHNGRMLFYRMDCNTGDSKPVFAVCPESSDLSHTVCVDYEIQPFDHIPGEYGISAWSHQKVKPSIIKQTITFIMQKLPIGVPTFTVSVYDSETIEFVGLFTKKTNILIRKLPAVRNISLAAHVRFITIVNI